MEKNKKNTFEIIMLVLIFFGIIFLLSLYVTKGNILTKITEIYENFVESKRKLVLPTGKPLPTAMPYNLPSGRQTYTLSRGANIKGPAIQRVIIEELTPKKGENLNITVTIANDSPIKTATATLYTDNKHQAKNLTLTEGEANNGTWTASWPIDDTYEKIYKIDFALKSDTGSWSGPLTFR